MKPFAEALIRRVAERSASARRMRGRRLVLAYHNVLPPDAAPTGDRSLHLPWRRFLDHLDVLADRARVIPITALLEDEAPVGDRPEVVITFDDAYTGTVEHALPELARRGVSATVFVPPGLLDGCAFWWDELADPAAGAVDDARRHQLLDELAGEGERVRAWATKHDVALQSPPPFARGASLRAIEAAVALPGIFLGAHSWSHPNLARLDATALMHQLQRPLEWLARFGERSVPAVAYPYGLTSDAVARATLAAGYRAGFRVEGGWMPDGPRDDGLLPRFNVPAGLSGNGLRIRLAGWRRS